MLSSTWTLSPRSSLFDRPTVYLFNLKATESSQPFAVTSRWTMCWAKYNLPGSPCTSNSAASTTSPLPASSQAVSSASMHKTCAAGMTVMIDDSRHGNWTRFVNHSYKSYTDFRMQRVGGMDIIVTEGVGNIPVGVQLTLVNGTSYYGVDMGGWCGCGARGCVSIRRPRRELF